MYGFGFWLWWLWLWLWELGLIRRLRGGWSCCWGCWYGLLLGVWCCCLLGIFWRWCLWSLWKSMGSWCYCGWVLSCMWLCWVCGWLWSFLKDMIRSLWIGLWVLFVNMFFLKGILLFWCLLVILNISVCGVCLLWSFYYLKRLL